MKIIHSTYNQPLKLKISLEHMPHPVYRRLLVPREVNMLQLHCIIQFAVGWQFEHLFQFMDKRDNAGIHVTIPMEEDPFMSMRRVATFKADQVKLVEAFYTERDAKPFWYWYDFGDDWLHRIAFQKATKKDLAQYKGAPVCVDMYGVCPPEDIGGPWGYASFLEIINDNNHPEHNEMREWAGIPIKHRYDENAVNQEVINETLAGYYNSSEWNLRSEDYFNG